MKTLNYFKAFLCCFLCTVSGMLYSQIQMSPLFSDNMVLQQQTDAPIWGKANPQSEVKIVTSWNKKEYTTTADASGKWMIKVNTPTAGGPYEISIKGRNTVKLKNVLIGEVWICSGQSNMEMRMKEVWGKVNNYEKEIEDAKYPNIRLLQIDRVTSLVPLSDITVAGGSWFECSPATIDNFSATGYFFGRNLHQNLNIPIGLINTSWGGTIAEAWTSAESLEMMPYFEETLNAIKKVPADATARAEMFRQQDEEYKDYILSKDFGYENKRAVAAESAYNDAAWKSMAQPGFWEKSDLPDFDGVVWFRKTIDIADSWNRKELTLSLGKIDDNDITFFNGTEVGRMNNPSGERVYKIPARLVKSGKAVIAVRVEDTGGSGGFYGDAKNMYIAASANGNSIDLSGGWKYKKAISMSDVARKTLAEGNPNTPTSLYNAMIKPLVPYAIKGAIWYQGESNADRSYQYNELFPLMINDWRTQWNSDFPFYFVQLANFMPVRDTPTQSGWAELRDAQKNTLHLSNTGMAVIIDIGDAADIHPGNKQDVGNRLAMIARAKDYGERIEYSGPEMTGYKIEGNKIRISFSHTTGGLKTKGNEPLKGFSIAGADQKFHWANAVIEGNDIVVSAADVVFPMAVRYAWADNPICNLYNGADLPASPFRTDNWVGVTFKATNVLP